MVWILENCFGHHTRMNTKFTYLRAAAERKDMQCYLFRLVNILRTVCCMTNEAGMESVLILIEA